jgi:hypothetical protein
MANVLGLRSVAFEGDGLRALVDRPAADGYRLVGRVGEYERVWRMARCAGRRGSMSPWPSGSGDPGGLPASSHSVGKGPGVLVSERRGVQRAHDAHVSGPPTHQAPRDGGVE